MTFKIFQLKTMIAGRFISDGVTRPFFEISKGYNKAGRYNRDFLEIKCPICRGQILIQFQEDRVMDCGGDYELDPTQPIICSYCARIQAEEEYDYDFWDGIMWSEIDNTALTEQYLKECEQK